MNKVSSIFKESHDEATQDQILLARTDLERLEHEVINGLKELAERDPHKLQEIVYQFNKKNKKSMQDAIDDLSA